MVDKSNKSVSYVGLMIFLLAVYTAITGNDKWYYVLLASFLLIFGSMVYFFPDVFGPCLKCTCYVFIVSAVVALIVLLINIEFSVDWKPIPSTDSDDEVCEDAKIWGM